MKKILYLIVVTLLASCINNHKFKVEGKIEGAAGETIYLEYTGLMKSIILDSTEIDDDGSFTFRAERPEYPDFYRLVLNSGQIIFAVDSTETITINANADKLPEYKIEGSQNNKDIQILRKSVSAIQAKASGIIMGMDENKKTEIVAEVISMIEEHKKIARPLILKNPRSTTAYFAIYQQVNNTYLFSPYDREDRPYCAAVATSYNTFMPAYDRSKNLYELVMDAIKKERQARNNASWKEIVANASTGYIDISLPDKNDNIVNLSSLQGKVILLDFSAYESRENIQYTFALRELYNQYASKGFEIYQVSLDRNKILWQESVANIPWICVRDENGPQSVVAGTYNISSIPTYFLINRNGDLIARNPDLSALKKAIENDL